MMVEEIGVDLIIITKAYCLNIEKLKKVSGCLGATTIKTP